jgi:hypothetical protein
LVFALLDGSESKLAMIVGERETPGAVLSDYGAGDPGCCCCRSRQGSSH